MTKISLFYSAYGTYKKPDCRNSEYQKVSFDLKLSIIDQIVNGQISVNHAAKVFAFACKVAFEEGYEGYISFHAKTESVEHYMKSLGAKRINSQLMYVDSREATILVNRYFKNFEI